MAFHLLYVKKEKKKEGVVRLRLWCVSAYTCTYSGMRGMAKSRTRKCSMDSDLDHDIMMVMTVMIIFEVGDVFVNRDHRFR